MSAGRFARALGRLHQVTHRRLSDAVGNFRPTDGPAVEKVDLQVDRNLTYESAEGRFITDQVGITWLAADIRTATRGDIFEIGCERFLVEKLIADDGYAITAATTKL